MNTMLDFRTDLNQHFGFLESDFGFSLASFTDEPRAFDNFVAVYSRGDIDIQVTRDRSQVFIAFRHDEGPWIVKDALLSMPGLRGNGFPKHHAGDDYELSPEYGIESQSNDLRKYLEIILENFPIANRSICDAQGKTKAPT